MNRIDRISAILIQLQSKPVVKAQEIADRFHISLRTVYRDIRTLEEAGVPIGSEAGKGYFMAEGYHLPPVMFSNEEAGSMLLAEKLVEKFADASINNQYKSAMYKIRAVLKPGDQEFLENINANIQVSGYYKESENYFPDNFMSDIQKAMGMRHTVKIHYHSISKDEVTVREIEPVGVCYYGANWHLIGHCLMRVDYRDFRVNRIKKLEVTDRTFYSSKNEGLEAFFKKMEQQAQLTKVKIVAKPEVKEYIDKQRYYFGYVEESDNPNKNEMTFLVPNIDQIAYWLLSYTTAIEVLEPPLLKDLMIKLVKDLNRHYLEK